MRVAFVPSAPFLLLGAGPPDLRRAIEAAVAHLGDEVVVVGAAPAPGWYDGSVDLTPYGVRGEPAQDPLALSLAVGRTLMGGRPHRLWGVPSDGLPDGDLLVVGDGTAKRTLKAPGHLDPRAEGYDAQVVDAIASGEPERLGGLDRELGEELWVGGLAAWSAVAGLVGRWQTRVSYAGAPYGVTYVVATWAS
jgi:hypothetical protein